MTKYVALLRGINVGGHRKVPMADLRRTLTELGYTEVRTLLQSGNAVFEAAEQPTADLVAAIEPQLLAEFGFAVDVMVRSADELRAVAAANPLEVRDPAKLAVAFLAEAPDPDVSAGLDPKSYAPDELRTGERELYMYCPDGLGKARVTPILMRRLGGAATVRNWNTVTKLLAMVE
ncbi:DUF1697 domain-containing protein [Embleya sp. NBC_00896]|uniref:DUF1697 domain-containing protein n=1 Tax=Embleya sp. NBC_00896 TaxID=2975961 RepID=UPI00386B5597|nr:DUF1697 domain-containing protein [Embleya sp. NBC_00896]